MEINRLNNFFFIYKMKVVLEQSPLKNKKYRMIFHRNQYEKYYTDFGQKNMEDYTIHKDDERKQRFLKRFQKLIHLNKNDYTSPMTLSSMLLWNRPTIEESFKSYLQHFHLSTINGDGLENEQYPIEPNVMEGMGIPFFSRVGGKSLVSKQIINMFPKEYDTYIEPFLGGGKVFLDLEQRPNVKYILNDKYKDIYYMWKDVKTIDTNIVKNFKFPQSKELFEQLKNKTNIKNKKDRLYRNLYLSFFSFSGNRINYMSKRSSKGNSFIKNIDKLQDKLKNTTILNLDYKKVINKYDNPNAIIYLDPPYYKLEKYYEGQAIDPDDLANVCRKMKGKFILSYNITPEVKKAFQGFNIKKLPIPYNMYKGKTRKTIDEYIITNF